MNEIEKEMNLKIIQNMNKRVNFLKNPRFVVKNPLLTYKHLMENSVFNYFSIFLGIYNRISECQISL